MGFKPNKVVTTLYVCDDSCWRLLLEQKAPRLPSVPQMSDSVKRQQRMSHGMAWAMMSVLYSTYYVH